MTFWLDEQISLLLAPWIQTCFNVSCCSVTDLPVDRGSDEHIFMSARNADAIVVSKDSDFVDLVSRLGPPPRILWVTCGNKSNFLMKEVLLRAMPQAIELFEKGEVLVEIA